VQRGASLGWRAPCADHVLRRGVRLMPPRILAGQRRPFLSSRDAECERVESCRAYRSRTTTQRHVYRRMPMRSPATWFGWCVTPAILLAGWSLKECFARRQSRRTDLSRIRCPAFTPVASLLVFSATSHVTRRFRGSVQRREEGLGASSFASRWRTEVPKSGLSASCPGGISSGGDDPESGRCGRGLGGLTISQLAAGITGVHSAGWTCESRQLALFPLLSTPPQRYNAKNLPALGRIPDRSVVLPTCRAGSGRGVIWEQCPPVQDIATGTCPI
jgi:hypothetical protein